MKIGIIVAMSSELACVKDLLNNCREEKKGEVIFYTGKRGKHILILTQSGIGKVCSATRTQDMIRCFQPDCILNTGVAGGIDTSTQVFDIVVGKEIVYHDVWCGDGNKPGQIQGFPPRFYSDPELLRKAVSLSDTTSIYSGLICSGDQFITDRKELNRIKATFAEGLAVDMESASIAQVCYMNKIPFLSFRIISDTPGIKDHTIQYNRFWEEAPQKSFEILKQLIDIL
ncbi:5'-methylthioadenosine/adenosylhomocysteine nucleosidase [Coprobacter sp.]